VIGGGNQGGILVRTEEDLKSPTTATPRLSSGATIKELKVNGDRMHFMRLSGEGPDVGWVSLKFKGKDLLRRL